MSENDKKRTPQREARIRRVLSLRQKDLTLVLSNIHDPHNVSAIYRSCDAFGVAKVHLHYTETSFPVLGAKSSASARKWVQTVRHNSTTELLQRLKAENMQILSTGFSEKAKPLRTYDLTRPTALILGNEHSGVEESVSSLCDGEIYIPMYGMIQSFNVSVAAAVLLAEASRQREDAGMYASSSYSPEELEAMYQTWIKK